MWKVAARWIVFALGLSLAACLPDLRGLVPPTPLSSTQLIASTAPAQSTPTLPASQTSSPVPTEPANATATFTPIPTFTPAGGTGTAPTASPIPAGTQPTATFGTPAATATVLVSVSLDKLPPKTVYKPVRIENKSRAQMDISLHCTTHQGLQTVLEYENVRNLSIKAPECDYVYVVYVGGRRIVGTFTLYKVTDVVITVYSDRVVIH